MARLTLKEKRKQVKAMNDPDRPISRLVKASKSNSSPALTSTSLRKRSRDTAAKRAARYKRAAEKLVDGP